MELHELRQEITYAHDEGFWHPIGEGPLYNYQIGTENSEMQVFGWHDTRWVLKHNLDIALDVGLTLNRVDADEDSFDTGWAKFPDKSVHFDLVDILYRGSVVDRVTVAVVDGSRATLPAPHYNSGGWVAGEWPTTVARLVNELQGRRDFDTYMLRSGIEVVRGL